MHTHKHVHVHFDIRPHDVRTAYPHSAVSFLSLSTLCTGAAYAGEEAFPTAQAFPPAVSSSNATTARFGPACVGWLKAQARHTHGPHGNDIIA